MELYGKIIDGLKPLNVRSILEICSIFISPLHMCVCECGGGCGDGEGDDGLRVMSRGKTQQLRKMGNQ